MVVWDKLSMKYLNYIPTPKEPVPVLEFLDQYSEAFSSDFVGVYNLKDAYKFDGWHQLIPEDYLVLYDNDGVQLTSFLPLASSDLEAKYYLEYGHSNSINTNRISEEAFQGYHKYYIGDKFTAVSVVPDEVIRITELIITGGPTALPI